jgi:hypothetical protein
MVRREQQQEHPGEPDEELEGAMRSWPEASLDAKGYYDHTLVAIPVSFLLNLLDRVRIIEQSMGGVTTLEQEEE